MLGVVLSHLKGKVVWESITGNQELRIDCLICSYKAKGLHNALHNNSTSLVFNTYFNNFSEFWSGKFRVDLTVSFVSMTRDSRTTNLQYFAVHLSNSCIQLLNLRFWDGYTNRQY